MQYACAIIMYIKALLTDEHYNADKTYVLVNHVGITNITQHIQNTIGCGVAPSPLLLASVPKNAFLQSQTSEAILGKIWEI